MHELSLCHSIHTIVERGAAGRPVETVHLRVGRLRQVVPETLTYCWSLVAADGPLAGSVLSVESVPVVLRCRSCDILSTIDDVLLLFCGACGSASTTIVTGEELLVTSLNLAEPTAFSAKEN